MILQPGEKVHVVERRSFDTDIRRHFVGEVEHVDISAFRATGYAFVYDVGSTTWVRLPERRTRLVPIGAKGFLINIVPRSTNIEAVEYTEFENKLVATDGADFRLDINEFGRLR